MLLSPAVVGASNALPASGASLPISSYSSIIPLPYTNTLLKMTSKHSENNRIIRSKVRYSIKNQKSDRCRLGDLDATNVFYHLSHLWGPVKYLLRIPVNLSLIQTTPCIPRHLLHQICHSLLWGIVGYLLPSSQSWIPCLKIKSRVHISVPKC